MDLAHCERQAKEVVQSSSRTMTLIQGELMTDSYFDSIAAEIQDLLGVISATLGSLNLSCLPGPDNAQNSMRSSWPNEPNSSSLYTAFLVDDKAHKSLEFILLP